MRLIISTIVALSVATSCFGADQPIDQRAAALSFKGIKVGQSTTADVKEAFPGAQEVSSFISARPRGSEAGSDRFRLGETSAGNFYFWPLDGVIERVSASFTHDSYPAVVAAVKMKYGEPTETKTSQLKTRAGATFDSETLVWKRPDGRIVIRERESSVDRMELTMETPKMQARDAERAKRSVEEAAKGL